MATRASAATSAAAPRVQVGLGADGQLPLPWLGQAVAASTRLSGAHALLIHGPAGAGHLELALVLAQATLCEAPPSPGHACGRCASCHLVATRVHPDLLLVLPDALRVQLGWVDDDDSKLHKSDAKPSRDVRVEQVRQAIAWAQQTSGRGRGKVLVVHPADALNGPAANALLKTLEEPPGTLRLLLTSADPERLLPTVRSRCQRLPLALPARPQAEAWLRSQGLDDAGSLLSLAGGSPLEALAWAHEGLAAALLDELPRRVASGDAGPLLGRPIPRVVDLLLKLAHDAQVASVGGLPRFYAPATLPPGVDLRALQQWQAVLLRTARHDEHPWSAALLIESLVTQATAVWPRAGQRTPGHGAASLHSAR